MRFDTRAVHAGPSTDPDTGDVVPPIRLSTTFVRDATSQPLGEHTYIRESNPNQAYLEAALTELEGGEAALAFASGMAAGVALFQSLSAGDHIVMPEGVYYGYTVAFQEYCAKWGIEADFVRTEDTVEIRKALRPTTRLVWVETPSNPMMRVVDLAGAADAAHSVGAQLLVDNTFATPALQRPLEHGADVILHSATKYFGGHSDVMGGCLVFARKDPLFESTLRTLQVLGAVLAPFNSWLILRGLRTLAVRMRAQSENAFKIARMLEGHPTIAAVHYPGLESNPGHALAGKQMEAYGAMVSFQMKRGRDAALATVGRARLFIRATSLGGVESLIEHRATSEGADATSPDDLVRLSVGLEHADDLIEDLSRALCPVE